MSSYEATGARAARVAQERRALPSGFWGMLILVCSEATYFGCLFGTYYYLRFHARHWPPLGTPHPAVAVPLILAGVLATTSLPAQLSYLAAKAARVAAARLFLLWTLVVQCGWFAYELSDLIDQLHKSRPQDNAYASIYYVVLGSDHAHVFAGIVINLWLLLRLTGGLTNYRLVGLRAAVFYTHFVNLLTLLVVGCLLSADV